MKLLYFVPIVLAVLIFFGFRILKNKNQSEKLKITLQMIGLFFCILSMIAVIISYSYSGDKSQLYKLSLPLIIGIIAIEQIRRNKKSST
jgi:branched-subunit amino acid transport protein AzlD